jgi:hypothetical protein
MTVIAATRGLDEFDKRGWLSLLLARFVLLSGNSSGGRGDSGFDSASREEWGRVAGALGRVGIK